MTEEMRKIFAAGNYIQTRTQIKPQIAIILGSGLGALSDDVEVEALFPYGDLPHFPLSTVAGHAGRLALGTLAGKNVALMQGRFHYYEGYAMTQVVFPVRVMQALGAEILIVTNAAGGLNPDFDPGDLMLITDHINMMGDNPLRGPNLNDLGPRFPDMTNAYNPDLRELTLRVAGSKNINLQQGIYTGWAGPSYETKAERRLLRLIGGDAVGMSTVPEVIAANHAGMRVLGLSAITNKATGDADQKADDHSQVVAMSRTVGETLARLLSGIIQEV